MADLLNFLTSIATILGTGLEIHNMIENPKITTDTKVLYVLRGLSVNSRAWKEIHQKYHSMHATINEIIVLITDPDHPSRSRNQSDIAANKLCDVINSGSMRCYINSLEKDLKASVKTIEFHYSEDLSSAQKTIDNLRKSYKDSIAEALDNILNCQHEVLKTHSDFCSYFSILKKLPDSNWHDSEVEIIFKYRKLLMTDFYQIIDSVDKILKDYLFIYNETLNWK